MSETPYDRAAATWVARRLGITPESIGRVNFAFEDGGAYSEFTWEPGRMILTFLRANHEESMEFGDDVTPGQFIQECSVILRELIP